MYVGLAEPHLTTEFPPFVHYTAIQLANKGQKCHSTWNISWPQVHSNEAFLHGWPCIWILHMHLCHGYLFLLVHTEGQEGFASFFFFIICKLLQSKQIYSQRKSHFCEYEIYSSKVRIHSNTNFTSQIENSVGLCVGNDVGNDVESDSVNYVGNWDSNQCSIRRRFRRSF